MGFENGVSIVTLRIGTQFEPQADIFTKQYTGVSVSERKMSQVFQRQVGLEITYSHEVPPFDSQVAENWEAGAIPALPPQR